MNSNAVMIFAPTSPFKSANGMENRIIVTRKPGQSMKSWKKAIKSHIKTLNAIPGNHHHKYHTVPLPW